MTTKATHPELVSDMSTEKFIEAFRRFTNRRGMVTDIYSDQGSTFLGTCNPRQCGMDIQVMQRTIKENEKEAQKKHAAEKIRWHFIPPETPHYGGMWEANIKVFKSHLRKVLEEHTLTYEEFFTVMSDIEAVMNSRPILQIALDMRKATTINGF